MVFVSGLIKIKFYFFFDCVILTQSYLNIGSYRAVKKPVLDKDHIEKRRKFCDKWLARPDDCEILVNVDEKKFCGGSTNKHQTVLRMQGERFNKEHIHHHKRPSANASCNILLCIGPFGKGPILLAEHKDWFDENGLRINTNANKGKPPGFDADSYEHLIENKLIPFLKNQLNEYIFMHDNAGIHTRKERPSDPDCPTNIQKIFEKEGVELADLPPNSPDLHTIENCLSLLSREYNNILVDLKQFYMPKNKSNTFNLLKRAWNNVSNDKVLKIYSSFLNRLGKVKSVGGRNNVNY